MDSKEGRYPTNELAVLESKYSFNSDDIYYYNVHRPGELVKRLQRRTEEFDPSIVPAVFDHAVHEQLDHYEVSQYFGTGHIIVFARTKSGKDLVLRATHALPSPEKYMDMEKEVIDKYAKVGIPSTTIVTSDASRKVFPFDFQIMLPLTGKDIESEWEGSKEDYDSMSVDLGRIIARQYQIPTRGWGRWKRDGSGAIVGAKKTHNDYLTAYLDHDLAVLDLFHLVNPDGIRALYNFFTSNDVRDLFSDTTTSFFVHHDIADHNIRYDGRNITALYDWENAVAYDPISDLGSAPTWKTHYPRAEKLVEGFVAELGSRPDNLDAKIAVYFLRTMLWKLQFALKGQRLNARHIELVRDALGKNNLSVEVFTDQVK